MFVKRGIKRASAGLGSSYASVSNDAGDTNYSGQRQALQPERDNFMDIQEWFIDDLKNIEYQIWLQEAYAVNAIDYPVSQEAFFLQPLFYGRRWDWIDPQKDLEAKKEERKMCITSLTELISERGGDIEEVFQQIAEENALAKKYNIEIVLDNTKPTTPLPTVVARDQTPPAKEGNSIVDEVKQILNHKNGVHA